MYIDRMRVHGAVVLLIYLAVGGATCVFAPETGTPARGEEGPESVLTKLVTSYETNSIEMFRSQVICGTDDFRFYVEQAQVELGLNEIKEQGATEYVTLPGGYVGEGRYVYLTRDLEIKIHDKLLGPRNKISFGRPLDPIMVEYLTSDSGNTGTGSEAVIRTERNTIRIESDVIMASFGTPVWEFQVGEQVLYVRLDSDGEWRVRLWFEFDR